MNSLTHTVHFLLLLRHDPEVRSALVQEVRDYMLGSDDHWESVSEHGVHISNMFNSAKKGRKAEVLAAFEQQANQAGKRAYYPSLLQIVYRSGSRQHVLMNRLVFIFTLQLYDSFNALLNSSYVLSGGRMQYPPCARSCFQPPQALEARPLTRSWR
jgi:hypothetical protein